MNYSYFIFILVLISFLNVSIKAQHSKISKTLYQNWNAIPKQNCFILFNNQADLKAAYFLNAKTEKAAFVFQELQKATINQTKICSFLTQKSIFYQSFWIINGIQAELDSSTAAAIANFTEVAKILPNSPIQNHQPIDNINKIPKNLPILKSGNDTLTWGLERILAYKLWEKGILGQGVTIGGQDTGYDWLHPALLSQYRGNNNGIFDHN